MRDARRYEFGAQERWVAFHETRVTGRAPLTEDGLQKKRIWWISDHGNVKITWNYKEGVKVPSISACGGHGETVKQRYPSLTINTAPEKYIHRLVATFFCPNPDSKTTVNHIDGNKQNNHYTNLEWCTNSENIKHYHRELKGKK